MWVCFPRRFGSQAAREAYPGALARVLGRLTDTLAVRYAITRCEHVLTACPEAAAQLFGPGFFPTRSAALAAWQVRPGGESSLVAAALADDVGGFSGHTSSGSAAASKAAQPSLETTDRSRFGYSYEAEAACADAASRAVDAERRRAGQAASAGDGDGWGHGLEEGGGVATASAELYTSERAVVAATEALQGVVRLLLPADAASEGDVYSAAVAARVLARALANARSGSAGTDRPGVAALAAAESLPGALGSACLRLLRWSKAMLVDAGATTAAEASPHGRLVGAALEAVAEAVRSPAARLLFHAEDGVGALLPYASTASPARSYTAVRALWTLSLSAACRADLDSQDAIHALCALVSPQTRKAKVVRMACAALANIARDDASARDGVPLMAETHLAASLRLLLSRSEDVDARSDATSLLDALSSNHRVLTSLERYDRELAAHRLTWSPVHSAPFWRENYAEFEAAGCRRLKILRALLRASVREMMKEVVDAGKASSERPADTPAEVAEPAASSSAPPPAAEGAMSPLMELELSVVPSTTTVAVACADVGEFAAAHPNGKL